jgi:hypothetical protein
MQGEDNFEGDIEPVTVAAEEVKIDTIKDAIKVVIKKAMAADGKYPEGEEESMGVHIHGKL